MVGVVPVAQLDRALASGAKGYRFESCRGCWWVVGCQSCWLAAFLLAVPAAMIGYDVDVGSCGMHSIPLVGFCCCELVSISWSLVNRVGNELASLLR